MAKRQGMNVDYDMIEAKLITPHTKFLSSIIDILIWEYIWKISFSLSPFAMPFYDWFEHLYLLWSILMVP